MILDTFTSIGPFTDIHLSHSYNYNFAFKGLTYKTYYLLIKYGSLLQIELHVTHRKEQFSKFNLSL